MKKIALLNDKIDKDDIETLKKNAMMPLSQQKKRTRQFEEENASLIRTQVQDDD